VADEVAAAAQVPVETVFVQAVVKKPPTSLEILALSKNAPSAGLL